MTYLELTAGMAEEIKAVVCKYHEAMPLAAAIGVLEIVKLELLHAHTCAFEPEDEE